MYIVGMLCFVMSVVVLRGCSYDCLLVVDLCAAMSRTFLCVILVGICYFIYCVHSLYVLVWLSKIVPIMLHDACVVVVCAYLHIPTCCV